MLLMLGSSNNGNADYLSMRRRGSLNSLALRESKKQCNDLFGTERALRVLISDQLPQVSTHSRALLALIHTARDPTELNTLRAGTYREHYAQNCTGYGPTNS
eukprot:jgi/Botrbrau1/11672/Bobra.0195s0003.1